MTTLEQINQLIAEAIEAENEFSAAEELEKSYSRETRARKNEAREKWDALHTALGELNKQYRGRWTAFGESKLGKLLTYWEERQLGEKAR